MSENWRRCVKPNCACAAPEHPGHEPRFFRTRSAGRRKTVARQLAAGEVGKVRREIARHAEFATTVGQIIEVNEKIWEARPAAGGAAGEDSSGTGGEKGAPGGARGGEVRRGRRHGSRGRQGAGLRERPGDGRTRSLEFMLGDRRNEWLAPARLEDLDYGDINGIKAAVREYPSK